MGPRYRRKSNGRKRTFRRSAIKKRSFRRSVRRVIYNIAETKIRTQGLTNTTVTSTANQELLFADAIVQGTEPFERIGNKIAVKNISFDLQCYFSETVASSAYIRVLLLYPRKGITTTDIRQDISATTPGVHGRPNPFTTIVLYDRKHLISGVNTNNGVNAFKFKFVKFMRMCQWNYDSLGTVDTQPVLYIASDSTAAANDQVIFNGTYSISYKDI